MHGPVAPASRPAYSMAASLHHWARSRPGLPAFVTEGQATSWASLRRGVIERARDLGERGVSPGHTIAIMGHNSLDWCVTALAVLDLGATILPVAHRTVDQELTYLLDHAGAAAVVADAHAEQVAHAAAEAADGSPAVVPLSEVGVVRGGRRVSAPRSTTDPPAIVAYTSGTTGRPKGVELTHANLHVGASFLAAADASRDVRILLVQPISYTSGLISTFLSSVCNGWTVVLERGFDPDRVLADLAAERVTTFRSVPVIWQEIADAQGFARADLSELRTAHVGGAPVSEELMATWQDRGVALCQGYGLTETCGAITFASPEDAVVDRRTVGRGGPHCEIEVRGPDGSPTHAGQVGEIHVRGPSVTRGYRSDAGSTAEAIVDGWLGTGDLASRSDDGLLEIVGRSRDLIISGGINVYPAEIEAVVGAIPGVEEVVVVAIPHPRFSEVPAAVVRARPGVTVEMVMAHCRKCLASHKVPNAVVFADEPLPRTSSGKLVKAAVRDRYYDEVVRAASR